MMNVYVAEIAYSAIALLVGSDGLGCYDFKA